MPAVTLSDFAQALLNDLKKKILTYKRCYPFFAILCLMLISNGPVILAEAPAEVLSIEQSVKRALQNNPSLLSAQKDIAIARSQIKQAKSLYYPRINFNMNYVRFRNETLGLTSSELGNVILEAPISDASGQRDNPLANNLYLGRIDFRQTLFSGGRLHYTVQLSKKNLQGAESSYEALKREVLFNTRRLFAQLLAAKRKSEVLTEAINKVQRAVDQRPASTQRLKLMEKKASFRQEMAEQLMEERKIKMDLQQNLGMEFFSQIEAEGSLDTLSLSLDLNAALAWAKQNRSELRQTELQAEVDRLSVDLSMAERYPVFLFGGAYEVQDTEQSYEASNWNAVLTMNIPLFNGFAGPARIKESRYRAERGYLNRVQLEDQIEREVRLAYMNVQHWASELEARSEELSQIKRLSPEASFIDSFIEWETRAELRMLDAQLNLFIERARLDQAMGNSL